MIYSISAALRSSKTSTTGLNEFWALLNWLGAHLKSVKTCKLAFFSARQIYNFIYFILYKMGEKNWSHLPLFREFSWMKSSHFSLHTGNLVFHMKAREFPMQISQRQFSASSQNVANMTASLDI